MDSHLAGGLTFGPDCDLPGQLILLPLAEKCQALFRYLPEGMLHSSEAVTIGLGVERNADCSGPVQDSLPGFSQVDFHSSIVVNGVRLDYWDGQDEDGGSLARLDLTAKDGSSATINAKTIWQEGSDGQTMTFLSPEDLGDATGSGEPTITLGSWHGGNCCRSLYLIQLSEAPQLLAISSAVVDSLGWELADIDGDGTQELIAGGGDLLELGCVLGIDSPLAIAAFNPGLGTYLIETGNWLQHYEYVATGIEEITAIVTEMKPPEDAGEDGNTEFRCIFASVVLPALTAGLINEHQLRELVSGLYPPGTVSDHLVDPLIDFVRAFPAGFHIRTDPWERLVTPSQLFIMTCPALQHAVSLIQMGRSGTESTTESVGLALTNERILAAYAETIACAGPALTSLELRLGAEPSLCLELSDRPSLCSGVPITANWALLESMYDASTRLAEEANIPSLDRERLHETIETRLNGCSWDFESCFASATMLAADEVARFALDSALLWTAQPGYQ